MPAQVDSPAFLHWLNTTASQCPGTPHIFTDEAFASLERPLHLTFMDETQLALHLHLHADMYGLPLNSSTTFFAAGVNGTELLLLSYAQLVSLGLSTVEAAQATEWRNDFLQGCACLEEPYVLKARLYQGFQNVFASSERCSAQRLALCAVIENAGESCEL